MLVGEREGRLTRSTAGSRATQLWVGLVRPAEMMADQTRAICSVNNDPLKNHAAARQTQTRHRRLAGWQSAVWIAARLQERSSLTAAVPPSPRDSAGKGPRVQWKGGLHKSWLRYAYTGLWSCQLRNKLAAVRVWSGPLEWRVERLSEDTLSGYCSYQFGAHLHCGVLELAVGEKSLENIDVLSICISSLKLSHYLKLVLPGLLLSSIPLLPPIFHQSTDL